jgi:hypothetical protein
MFVNGVQNFWIAYWLDRLIANVGEYEAMSKKAHQNWGQTGCKHTKIKGKIVWNVGRTRDNKRSLDVLDVYV